MYYTLNRCIQQLNRLKRNNLPKTQKDLICTLETHCNTLLIELIRNCNVYYPALVLFEVVENGFLKTKEKGRLKYVKYNEGASEYLTAERKLYISCDFFLFLISSLCRLPLRSTKSINSSDPIYQHSNTWHNFGIAYKFCSSGTKVNF